MTFGSGKIAMVVGVTHSYCYLISFCKVEFNPNMLKIEETRFRSVFQSLKNKKILVVGDLILDEYLFGSVSRISPEAPVPIVWIRKEKITLGGAGNVVKNLSALGIRISIIGRVGKDDKAETMKELLIAENIEPTDLNLIYSQNVPTIIKTRIIASQQQVCRVDREENIPIQKDDEEEIFAKFKEQLPGIDGIILSDYDKGLLSPTLIKRILNEAFMNNTIVTVDPQVSHFFEYQKATIMTPNNHEAGKALGRVLEDDKSIEVACKEISNRLDTPYMMITRGDRGMTVYRKEDDCSFHIQTVAKEVFDVTGAGDTVITVLTAFHAAGMDIVESSIIANAAAGVVVGKLGASTASIEEIHAKLMELGSYK